jgi:glycosyltransferase involved in cell wall biosynthesis
MAAGARDRGLHLMRVWVVITTLAPGGAERSTVELLPALDAAGIDARVVCLRSVDQGWESDVRDRGTALTILAPGSPITQARELRALVRQERPDLVHTTLFDADLVGRLAALGGPPVLTSLVNIPYDPERRRDPSITPSKLSAAKAVEVTMSRLTRHFHAISVAVKEAAVAQLRIAPGDITVIHRGRDRRRLGTRTDARRRAARRTLRIDANQPMILGIGRQEYQKGQRYLIDAFEHVLARHPRAVLVIAGREGAVTDDLRRRAHRVDPNRVRLVGHRRDVPDLICAADVFVMPSLYEGLGGATIEALALQCPVIASDLAAFRGYMRHEENSLLVPPRDEWALVSAIDRLLTSPEYAARLARAGAIEFERQFTLQSVNDRMVALYRSVAERQTVEATPA